MARLSWDVASQRFFETGLDRGVFYPKTGNAVPWVGLISVDESGSDGATEYFIDGRPFLYLPQPKEYAATLKAYTYPNEFATVMGWAEIDTVDGVYLDSQTSDSFDLSYRTLVGNSLDGIDHAYKIHLVYNATVVPQGQSSETLNSSINPIDFSWEIKAVPVPVEGYRPTAHIVIDTRHMDSAKVAQIEELLYGDSDTIPSMPNPTDIMEILTVGNSIIITDNGDGTWSATGSYKKIYMVDEPNGVFQIDDVNAVDHGDGTFDISTTIA